MRMPENGRGGAPIAIRFESSLYLEPAFTGRGIGTQLYQALLVALRTVDSRGDRRHRATERRKRCAARAAGLSKVAHFKEVGYKFGQWLDVGYWQRSL